MIKIQIRNKKYNVKEAFTEDEKIRGLQNINELPKNEGMIFYYNPPQKVSFWMKNVNVPLDIIFLNDDQEVIKVVEGVPNNKKLIKCSNVSFVVEVNKKSGIKVGDQLEFENDKAPTMKVLAQDGSEQYQLWGGERIFSRKNTKILFKKAIKADQTKSDSDYKSLGKYIFKCIKIQDNRDPEYVNMPE